MELRQIRAAHELAAHRHFGRAATSLGITQSSLSQSIRTLEAELGVTLFERTTRTVSITEAGRSFVDQSAPALTALDRAADHAKAVGRGEAGSLVIGLVGSAMTPPLPALLRRFRSRSRAVAITIRELTTGDQIDQLRRGGVDVGFLRPPVPAPADRDLRLTTIATTPLVAALPQDHRLAAAESLSLQSLAGEPFVRTPRELGPGLYDHITALCRRAGFVPETVQEATQISSIVGLVAAGFGVSVIPAPQGVHRDARLIPLTDPQAVVELAMAVPRQRPASPPVAAFTRLVSASIPAQP